MEQLEAANRELQLDAVRRQHTEDALRHAHERLRRFVDANIVGVVVAKTDGGILEANDYYLRLIGSSREELDQGKADWRALTPAEWLQVDEQAIRELRRTGHCPPYEKEYLRRDGTRVPLLLALTLLPGPEEQVAAFVLDLTERKHIEVQLRQAQKMEAVGQLASGVAHDFNNLLTIIHGHAALQLAPDLAPEERVNCARQIIMAAERAAGLTRQLLLFGRKQVMQPTTLDLNEVVGGTIKMLKRILGEDVALHSELAPALPPLCADVGMIEQILLNLAVNSRDAMPTGGRLTIATGTQVLNEAQARQIPEAVVGRFVYLDVSDTGGGIPPAVLPRIFEPFFTTKEPGKGTGLGLATVHGIVQQHHGWINVTSELGRGTAFRIFLPAMEPRLAASTSAPAPARMPNGHETILVVEDEPALRLLAGNVLQRCGYTVIRAESAVAALALWTESKPPIDLLFTDLVMPGGMSGFELAAKLQTERPDLAVIFASGYGAKAGSGPVLIEGENFLQKPFAPQKLARTVRECLDRRIARTRG